MSWKGRKKIQRSCRRRGTPWGHLDETRYVGTCRFCGAKYSGAIFVVNFAMQRRACARCGASDGIEWIKLPDVEAVPA